LITLTVELEGAVEEEVIVELDAAIVELFIENDCSDTMKKF